MRVLLLAVLVIACKSEDQQVNEYLVKSATKGVAELKQILVGDPAKRPLDWGLVTRCADMVNIDRLAHANRALASELLVLCTRDVPLAMMKVETERAEAAVKAKPNAEIWVECHSPTFNFAKDQMAEAKTLGFARDAIARFEAVCPKK